MAKVIFDGSRLAADKLTAYSFVKNEDVYLYKTDIAHGQFEMTVAIDSDGEIETKVTDKAFGDEYVLHLTDSEGAFVGAVRDEYERVLADIRKNCYIGGSFDNRYVDAITEYVKEKYGDGLEFLWERTPDNAILRRKDSGKWYAAILTVGMDKLGFDSSNAVCIIDLHASPERVAELVDGEKFLPGYHMNKKSWYTIRLDGSVDIEEIFPLIDESYQSAAKKGKK